MGAVMLLPFSVVPFSKVAVITLSFAMGCAGVPKLNASAGIGAYIAFAIAVGVLHARLRRFEVPLSGRHTLVEVCIVLLAVLVYAIRRALRFLARRYIPCNHKHPQWMLEGRGR